MKPRRRLTTGEKGQIRTREKKAMATQGGDGRWKFHRERDKLAIEDCLKYGDCMTVCKENSLRSSWFDFEFLGGWAVR